MIDKWIESEVFANVSYTGQKLRQIEFDSCSFQGCDFSGAELSDCDFISCRFENCNFSMTKLNGSGMKDVNFSECKLMGINFDHCSDFLFTVGFQKCVLDYSSFVQKKMKNTRFSDCSLKEVDFSSADLTMSVFHHCQLGQSVFLRTNLEKVDFRTAVNYSFDPELNRIKKAKFSYSGLPGLLGKYNIDVE